MSVCAAICLGELRDEPVSSTLRHDGLLADDEPIPASTTPDAWADHPDYQDGGFWMLVDIDMSKVRSRAVRLNISLPESLVRRIDATARQRGQSRSAVLATAAERDIEIQKVRKRDERTY